MARCWRGAWRPRARRRRWRARRAYGAALRVEAAAEAAAAAAALEWASWAQRLAFEAGATQLRFGAPGAAGDGSDVHGQCAAALAELRPRWRVRPVPFVAMLVSPAPPPDAGARAATIARLDGVGGGAPQLLREWAVGPGAAAGPDGPLDTVPPRLVEAARSPPALPQPADFAALALYACAAPAEGRGGAPLCALFVVEAAEEPCL